jgi:hypothetical protein
MSNTQVASQLTLADRCDRCGAAAQAKVILKDGELLFCGHHARKHNDKLIEMGAMFVY